MEQKLNSIRKMHLAISIGLAIAALVIYIVIDRNGPFGDVLDQSLSYEFGGLIAVFVLTALGMILMRRDMSKAKAAESLVDKMEIYRTSSVKLYATIELSFIIVMVLYCISGLMNLYLYSLLTFVYFVYNRPHPLKLINDMKLDEEDKETVREAFK